MALESYSTLYDQLKNKRRGRLHEAQINNSPSIWAALAFDDNIYCHLETRGCSPQHVATLRPDNTLTVDIHGWHTRLSCMVIETLTSNGAWLRKGVLWCNNHPVVMPLQYDCRRETIYPEKFLTINTIINHNLTQITLEDMPARERLMIELGTYKPRSAVTANVIAYVTGKADKSVLNPRDIYTILEGTNNVRIQERIFEGVI